MGEDFALELEHRALGLAPVMVRDLDGRIRLWTAGMTRLYGFAEGDALGRFSHELLATVFPRPLVEIEADLHEHGLWTGDVVNRRVDETSISVATTWSLIRGSEGEPCAIVEFNQDVTREKRAEEACRRLASIVESSHDAIIGKSLDGVVTNWNKGAEETFGYTAAEMLGRPISILFPPSLLAEEELILDRLRQGERIDSYETTRLRKDGREIHVALSVSPITDETGHIIGASKIARDITEQRQTRERLDATQAELVHISRLTAMGEMSAALAHELNQPLTAVSTYLSGVQRLLQAKLDVDSRRISDAVGKAVEQALRCGEIIRRLRDFVTRGDTVRRAESVAGLVEEACALALVGARQIGVRVLFELQAEDSLVVVDKVQVQQVLLNLIRNAMEAMADGERRELTLSSTLTANALVEICVADTGSGLAPEVAARLFQPFVTTKAKGMGVGLSICRTIIEAQGGRIWATPNPGGGTAFHLTLPLARVEAPADAA